MSFFLRNLRASISFWRFYTSTPSIDIANKVKAINASRTLKKSAKSTSPFAIEQKTLKPNSEYSRISSSKPLTRSELLTDFVQDPVKAVLSRVNEIEKKHTTEDTLNRMTEPVLVKRLRCPVCVNKQVLDYRNVQLLSEYVTYDGVIKVQLVTGICDKQHALLVKMIRRSKAAGLMPYMYKQTLF